MVAEKKYIKNDTSVFGVYAGMYLLNQFGLTTQVPNKVEIVTNHETTRKRQVIIEGRAFILRKARCEITKENAPVYTILQLFYEMDDSEQLSSFSRKQISNYIENNGISAEDLLSMSECFPAATLKKMVRSKVIYGTL